MGTATDGMMQGQRIHDILQQDGRREQGCRARETAGDL